jgi:hypothetical protein
MSVNIVHAYDALQKSVTPSHIWATQCACTTDTVACILTRDRDEDVADVQAEQANTLTLLFMNWYFCLHCARLRPILAKNSSILCSPAVVHTFSLLATYVLCGTHRTKQKQQQIQRYSLAAWHTLCGHDYSIACATAVTAYTIADSL